MAGRVKVLLQPGAGQNTRKRRVRPQDVGEEVRYAGVVTKGAGLGKHREAQEIDEKLAEPLSLTEGYVDTEDGRGGEGRAGDYAAGSPHRDQSEEDSAKDGKAANAGRSAEDAAPGRLRVIGFVELRDRSAIISFGHALFRRRDGCLLAVP